MPNPAPPSLYVLVLGPLDVRVDGAPRPLSGRKQRVLLTRLALSEGRPVPIDALAEDLWEDKQPRDAAHALQAHVSRLRATLGVTIDFVDGAGYRLAAEQATTDARDFTSLCERGRAQLAAGSPAAAVAAFDQALDLWRGPVLGDFVEIEGLRPFALRLEGARRAAASERIDACLALGPSEEVISELRESLDLDPLQERGWQQLMVALHRSGRLGEALLAYQRAREAFIDELGVEPGRQLTQLHAELLRADGPATEQAPPGRPASSDAQRGSGASGAAGPTRPPVRPTAAGSHSTLVGRGPELALLAQAWSECADGLRVVTVSGEPGVGKSRLASEFAGEAANAGARTLVGHCDHAIVAPYQPFVTMLGSYLEERLAEAPEHLLSPRLERHIPGLVRVLPRLADLFPEAAERAFAPSGEADEYRSLDAVAAWLATLSEEQPLLLVVEDLHWADEQTMLLLRHLLRSPRTIRALIVATVRDRHLAEHPAPGAADPALVEDILRQSERTTHLALNRLEAGEIAELFAAETASAESMPPWASEYVQQASGGNPLFIVELARQLLTAGPCERVPAASAGIRQVIESRVAALPGSAPTLLRRAAVLGTEFDTQVLARVAAGAAQAPGSQTLAEVDAMHAATIHAQLIEPVHGASRHAFSHDVVRRTLYESLPPSERAQLHGRTAVTLEHHHADDLSAHHHEIAHHLRLSDLPGAARRAARHLLLAGRDALRRGAPTDAERLLSSALHLLGAGTDPGLRCDLLTGLGQAQLRCARPEYRQTLLEATRLAADIGDSARLIDAVLKNSRGLWSSALGIDHERVAGIETALARCDPDRPLVRARLLAAWSMENVRDTASRRDVLTRSAQALELAEEAGDAEVLAAMLASRYSVMYALFEQPAECLRVSERLLEVAQQLGDRGLRLAATTCLAQASMMFGEFRTADRHIDQALQLAQALHLPVRVWLLSGWQAMREAMRGRLQEAERLAEESAAIGARAGQRDAATWFAGQIFSVRMMQGRLPEIREQVSEQAAGAADAIPAWRAAMALTLAASGKRGEGGAILEEFTADLHRLPQDFLWLHGMCYLSMTCDVLERDDVAGRLYGALAPYAGMVATNGTIDAGPVDLQLGALAHLTGRHDLAGEHLEAAAALCRRIDAPLWLEQVERRRV